MDDTYGNFASIDLAKQACKADNCCSAVQDGTCNGGSNFKLCKSLTRFFEDFDSKEKDCTHQKTNYTPGFIQRLKNNYKSHDSIV